LVFIHEQPKEVVYKDDLKIKAASLDG